MSKITDIRNRQIIDCSGAELLGVISAALSADFKLLADGGFTLEPWKSGLSKAGETFRAAFSGRRFSNLESVAACVIDTEIEQGMSLHVAQEAKGACPFCGESSTRLLTPYTTPPSTHAKGFQVECFNCAARGPCGYGDEASARLAWVAGDGIRMRMANEN